MYTLPLNPMAGRDGEYKIEEYLEGHGIMFHGILANIPYRSVVFYSSKTWNRTGDSLRDCMEWAEARKLKIVECTLAEQNDEKQVESIWAH